MSFERSKHRNIDTNNNVPVDVPGLSVFSPMRTPLGSSLSCSTSLAVCSSTSVLGGFTSIGRPWLPLGWGPVPGPGLRLVLEEVRLRLVARSWMVVSTTDLSMQLPGAEVVNTSDILSVLLLVDGMVVVAVVVQLDGICASSLFFTSSGICRGPGVGSS